MSDFATNASHALDFQPRDTHRSLSTFTGIGKRGLDLCVAFLALWALAPLLVLVALAIRLESRGPVFFQQRRVGLHGETFWIYKFRSMYLDAEERQRELAHLNEMSGPLFKMKDDPRVTRVGRWLRRTSIDELPQLVNVLFGEMSLVGPRPPLPSEVEQFQPWQLAKFRVRPGVTGLWQVSGRSELTSFDSMIALDLDYVRTWSLGLDLSILGRTLPAVLKGHGAH